MIIYGGWLFLQLFFTIINNIFTIIFYLFSSDSKPEWNQEFPVTEPSNLTTRLRISNQNPRGCGNKREVIH